MKTRRLMPGLSDEGFALGMEMFANEAIDVDAIIAYVRRDTGEPLTFQSEPGPGAPQCSWCEQEIPTPQDAFLDERLTGIFGYWYCSEQCRDAHVESK